MAYENYQPKVAWTTIVRDVVYLPSGDPAIPDKYQVTVSPQDTNEPGAELAEKAVGWWLKDYIGHTYLITAINVGGDPTRIEVEDQQFCGYGPQSEQYGDVFESVGDNDAPYIAPVDLFRLDQTSQTYTRSMELEILWREIRHNKPIKNVYVGRSALINTLYDPLGDSAENNTAVGYFALNQLTVGKRNTVLGSYAGVDIDTLHPENRIVDDTNLTLIGYNATKDNVAAITNSMALGYNSRVTKSNQVVIGNLSVTEVLTYGSIIAPAESYASGGYDILVRNTISGRFEKIASSSFTNLWQRTGIILSPATVGDYVSVPTINLTSGPGVGKVWTCTDALTGAGAWITLSGGGGTGTGASAIPFTNQTSVTVNHAIGAYPNVDIIDSTGATMVPETLVHADLNTFTVTFPEPESGTIIITYGIPPTIALGTVTTGAAGSSVIITNSGTSSQAVFNFTIPRGDKGDKGDKGDPGVGVPVGGTANQVLAKTDGTDYNTYWMTLPSGMVYPGAGIAVSTGSAWGTSITDNSSNWNAAYGWGNHAGLYLLLTGGTVTGTITSTSSIPLISKILGTKSFVFHHHGTENKFFIAPSTSINAEDWDWSKQTFWDGDTGNFTVQGVITATGGNSTNWNTAYSWGNHASAGYLLANQTITLSGDVSGSGSTTITTTIGANKVTLAMLDQIATASFLGRITAATGNVEVLTVANVQSMLGLGSAAYTASSAYQAASTNLTSIASLSYSSASFVKMTAAGTFTLDTNTYSLSSHNHAGVYEPVLGNPTVDGYILSSTIAGVRSWIAPPTGGGSGQQTKFSVVQTGHGLSVGNIIRNSGSANTYVKAQADSVSNSEVIGIVTVVTDADNFTYVTHGVFETGVPAQAAGTVLFLDPDTAGALTTTEPSIVGQVSKPLVIILENGSKAIFQNFRGFLIGAATTSDLSTSVISGNTTAVNKTLYVLTGNAAITLTLPASPSVNDTISVVNLTSVLTCVIARNGNNIMASATDLTLDKANAGFSLHYSGPTNGWVII